MTNGVKTDLHYVVCCSNLCILSNRQMLGSKFGFVLFSFLTHCPPALAPAMVWLLFSLFFPFCLTKSWLIEVYQVKFVSWKIYKKLPSFRCQPSDDIMWACLPSSCRMSGWMVGGGGCEAEPCLLPSASVWSCLVAVLQNKPNLPPPLGRAQGGPPADWYIYFSKLFNSII